MNRLQRIYLDTCQILDCIGDADQAHIKDTIAYNARQLSVEEVRQLEDIKRDCENMGVHLTIRRAD